MRKLLLLITALLTLCVGGAWAAETITVANTTGAWLNGSYYGTAGTAWNTGWTANMYPALAGETVPKISIVGTAARYMTNAGVMATTTFTITLEEGTITDYSISFTSNTNGTASTITAADGTSASTSSNSEAATLNVTSLSASSTSFTVSGAYAATTAFTVTYEPAAASTSLYRIKSNWQSYLYASTSNSDDLYKKLTSGAPSDNDLRIGADYVFEVKKQAGKVIYLKSETTGRYAAVPSSASQASAATKVMAAENESNAESFSIVNRSSSAANAVALQSSTGYSSSTVYLNVYTSSSNYVGWHNAQHQGDVLLFIPVKKVSFVDSNAAAFAIAVNGGDAASVIYVPTDGSDSFTLPSSYLYSIDGATAVTNTEAAATIAAAGTDDITVTVSDNPSRNVTYILNWSDGTQLSQVTNVTAYLNVNASEFLPSAMANDCVTLNYSPETITSETSEVVVTATWNGPFQLSDSYASAKWYTVGIHSSYESANHIWKYVSDGSTLGTEAVPTDAYYSLSDANCFAFTGNPYTGITIYNKAAGSGLTVTKSNDNTQATVSASGSLFVPQVSSVANKTVADGYACFQVKDGSFYLNSYASEEFKIFGWDGNTDTSGNDAGSTCWFLPAGQYYLNYIDGLALAAPVGAVGTSKYFTTVADAATAKSTLTSLRSTIAGALYSDMATLATVNKQLDPVRNAGTIALTDGYYRIVSAVERLAGAGAWLYDTSTDTDHIVWSNDATSSSNQINSIFKLANSGSTWTVFCPNAQKYIIQDNAKFEAQTATLGDDGGEITISSQGSTQYSLKINGSSQALAAHESYNEGQYITTTNTRGQIKCYNFTALGHSSTWYIVKVSSLNLTLNDGGDGNYYATACLPFDVTLTGCSAYTLTLNSAKTALTLSEALTEVPAGTPVLLRGTSATATASIASNAATGAPLTNTSLTGTYVSTTIDGTNDYVLGSGDNGVGFYHWDGTTLAANRAYLPASAVSGDVKGFALDFGLEDAIEALKAKEAADGAIYNLSGQRVEKAQRGIYIVGGKKVVVK